MKTFKFNILIDNIIIDRKFYKLVKYKKKI